MRLLFAIAFFATLALAGSYSESGLPTDQWDDWLCKSGDYDELASVSDAYCTDIPQQELSCDCGCGTYDPDCDLPSRFRPKSVYDPANKRVHCSPNQVNYDGRYTLCQREISECFTVPLEWTCEPRFWNQRATTSSDFIEIDSEETAINDCHCGCGIWDPDCDYQEDEDVAVRCGADNWEKRNLDGEVCTAQKQCMEVPSGWSCKASYYNEVESGIRREGDNRPICDCGCGIPDPDCVVEHKRSTEGQNHFGLYCHDREVANSNNLRDFCNITSSTCTTAPPSWTCPARYYSESTTGSLGPNDQIDCNCNCGNGFDPDCTNSQAIKRRNGASGLLCRGGNREDETNPSYFEKDLHNFCVAQDSNTACVSVPNDWSIRCIANFFDETGRGVAAEDSRCDCACGIWDPDCDNREASLYCNPDQSVSKPSGNRQWCSQVTLQCRSGPAPADKEDPAWVAYFDEFTYGPAPDRSAPRCDCGSFSVWDPDCDHQLEIDSNCDDEDFCSREDNECVNFAPDDWSCHSLFYDQLDHKTYPAGGIATCDCGCGVWDPDCNTQEDRVQYSKVPLGLRCNDQEDFPADDRTSFCEKKNLICSQAPGAWYGPGNWFNETRHGSYDPFDGPYCHCGLGMYDPDCENKTAVPIAKCSLLETDLSDENRCTKSCPNCIVETLDKTASSASPLGSSFFAATVLAILAFA